MVFRLLFILLPVCCLNLSLDAAWEDNFESSGSHWQSICFEGTPSGSYRIENGLLTIDSEGEGFSGVYHTRPISGHFYATADFVADDNVALVLFRNKDGKPDPDNYTLIRVETLNNLVRVAVNDRQLGKKNVLDRTNSDISRRSGHPKDGYVHVLEGDKVSLPYTKTDKRMKILRHKGSDYFQFYYGVRASFYGSEGADWMELKPTPNWISGDSYFVALVSTGGQAQFSHIGVQDFPEIDRVDTATGFALSQRDYNWSGYAGPAHVITFGKENPFQEKDLKFVFWSEFNWVPHWYLTDQLAYCYEFVETWTGPELTTRINGCYEPMSDRLRVHSEVSVLEDNPVRKVIRWKYSLLNSRYEIPYMRGSQMPLVYETYTLYADGMGVRHIRYYPKLDIDEVDWNEVSEPMLISGNNSNSSFFADNPPLTLFDLTGRSQELHASNTFGYGSEVDDYLQVIAQAHFKASFDLPDMIEVFSTDPAYPNTYTGTKLRFEHTWQSPDGIMTHWPVNKRPYHGMAYSGPRSVDPHVEVSHASLVSVGCRELDIYPANAYYEKYGRTDPVLDRKYMEWAFLIGPVAHRDFEEARDKTRSWLVKDDAVSMVHPACEFLGISREEKALVFRKVRDVSRCGFTLDPPILINPVLRIEGWSGKGPVEVCMNGEKLTGEAYRAHLKCDGNLLIFIHATLTGKTEISVRDFQKY